MSEQRFRHAFLIALVVAVSFAFFAMIRAFALTILLAAIFAALVYPVFSALTRRLGDRRNLAAGLTLVMVLLLILLPLGAVLAAGANEAVRMSQVVAPRLTALIKEPGALESRLSGLPGYALVAPYRVQILARASEVIGQTGAFVVSALSATTVATATFLFHLVVLLYTMFFFLIDGPALLRTCVGYMPLSDVDKGRMLDRFVSVTRATLKGTILIGTTQGVLCGVAFWVVGIDGAIFWGTVMVVGSIVPGVGGALVWVPAVVGLLVTGNVLKGIGLAVFCGLVVGSIDNLMRPRLVGKDTQLHTLLIFFSTLGGLALFGVTGFIVGPILAALFVTSWDIFGTAFHRELAGPPSSAILPDDPSLTNGS